jgi:hypothetical protein
MTQSHLIESPTRPRSGSEGFIDAFSDERSAGRVIGTTTAQGILRAGADKEGVLGVDHGALRIRPLNRPGWGRAGIAYGPYARRNGLAFGTLLLNGHNTSQAEPLPESLGQRLKRWCLGSEADNPRTRMLRWVFARQRKFFFRTLIQWIRSGSRFFRVNLLNENLAVGWFPSEAPTNPLQQGNGFIMHALGPECGELWARVGLNCQRTVRGLQNVPVCYLVILREQGAAYYAASIPGVPGLDAYPTMRLLGIDSFNQEPTLFAGVHQSVLGQIGFRVDTRVYRTQVATLDEFSQWYGSAHGADRLRGEGSLHLSDAEVGGRWTVYEGSLERASDGLALSTETSAARLHLGTPAGLIHLIVKTDDQVLPTVAVIWRSEDEANFWCFELNGQHAQLSLKENGVWIKFPITKDHCLYPSTSNALQVCDDGENISLYLNGELVYATRFFDERLREGMGVGFRVSGNVGTTLLHSFEAHPRRISLPATFDLGTPWFVKGNRVCIEDKFTGLSGELDKHVTDRGAKPWRRELGRGVIELTGKGSARVCASVENPCPGRTAYTIPWDSDDFADVEVTVTPPGKFKGQSGWSDILAGSSSLCHCRSVVGRCLWGFHFLVLSRGWLRRDL